jgi:hypothetical protein
MTYTNQYSMSTCPPGTHGQWDELAYSVTTPAGSDVKFAVQVGPSSAGPWSPSTGTPAGILVADAPIDHPAACSMTGPSPVASTCGASGTAACTPTTGTCPIDVGTPISSAGLDPGQPDLQLDVLLTPGAVSCAGVLSPGLLTQPNGLTQCAAAHDDNGTSCTAATQYSACDQDYHCDLVAASPTYQTCIYNNGAIPWIDPNCAVGGKLGFDLTIEPSCENSSSQIVIPVCNRGGAAIPAGQTIVVTESNYSASCTKTCSAAGASPYGFTADCQFALTSPLGPGSCVNIPPSASCAALNSAHCLQVNPGNTVVDVNGNKECNTTASGAIWTANGTGAGCTNNDSYAKDTHTCDACGAPLSGMGGAPSLTSWSVTYSCVPSE